MNTNAQSDSNNVPKDWQTLAEQTDYRKSWNYADTIAFAQKLAKASRFDRIQNIRKKRAKAEKCRS